MPPLPVWRLRRRPCRGQRKYFVNSLGHPHQPRSRLL